MKNKFGLSLLLPVLVLGMLLASPGQARSQQLDGIPVGSDFDLPVFVGGKLVTGKALVTPDKIMRVYYVVDGKIAGPLFYEIIRKDAPKPPTPPTPDPKPPTPDPKPPTPANISHVYIIHESADGGPNLVAIRAAADSGWGKELTSRGKEWLIIDKDNAKTKFPKGYAKAMEVGLPAVVMRVPNGEPIVEKLPMPAKASDTPAALWNLIKTRGGF